MLEITPSSTTSFQILDHGVEVVFVYFCLVISIAYLLLKNAQTDNQTKIKLRICKNRKSFETFSVFITGDERIELPLKFWETSVIPFDQSLYYCVRDTSYILANISEVVNDFLKEQ